MPFTPFPFGPCYLVKSFSLKNFYFPAFVVFESSNEMSAQKGRLLGWLEGNLLSACLIFIESS